MASENLEDWLAYELFKNCLFILEAQTIPTSNLYWLKMDSQTDCAFSQSLI